MRKYIRVQGKNHDKKHFTNARENYFKNKKDCRIKKAREYSPALMKEESECT